jgi:hypothetical protein
MNLIKKLLIITLTIIGTFAQAQTSKLSTKKDSTDDEKLGLIAKAGDWGLRQAKEYHDNLPRVLLIGNSVCSQYSRVVVPKMEGKADIDVWVTPANLNSSYLHERLAFMLNFADYDIVHFNIGLHGWSKGRIPKGKYEELMEAYVAVYEKEAPNATLIWASTTSISETREDPTVLDPINNVTIVNRNAMAKKIMKKHRIRIDDLYTLTTKHLETKGDRFHFKPEGVELLSGAVIIELEKAIKKRK